MISNPSAAADLSTALIVETSRSGSQPASVGTTPGTAATAMLTATGGVGGNTSIATTGVGGVGGGFAWTGGAGGTAASANTASTGGVGGGFSWTGGVGGAAAGTGTNVGGAGGALQLTGGAGGAASGGTGNTGGAGGSVYIVGGAAGSGGSPAAGNTLLAITSGGTARGRVGIGTASPSTALHVYASSGTIYSTVESGDGESALVLARGAAGSYANVIYKTGASTEWAVGTRANDVGYQFSDESGSGGTGIRMYLGTDGRIGINTAVPSALLDIAGIAWSGGDEALIVTPGAHTSVTAEASDIVCAAHTITITGAFATQRFTRFMIPTISAATALTVTTGATVYIEGAPAVAGAGPAAITNKYSLWIDAGLPRIDSATANGTVATAMSSVGPTGATTTIQEWLTIDIGGNTRYIPCWGVA